MMMSCLLDENLNSSNRHPNGNRLKQCGNVISPITANCWVSQMALVVKNPLANAGDTNAGLIPGLGRSPGVGNNTPLQYSCLENSMGRGAWWATVHRATESQTQLSS